MHTIEYKALYFCAGLFLGVIVGYLYIQSCTITRTDVLPIVEADFYDPLSETMND